MADSVTAAPATDAERRFDSAPPTKKKPKKSTVERCRERWGEQQCITIRHSITGEIIETRPCVSWCPLLNEPI